MAPNATVSFWDPYDINGTPLHTIDDEDPNFKGITLKPDLNGLGGWELILSREWAYGLLNDQAARGDVFVRFLISAYSDTEWYWGGLLDKRAIDVVHRDELGAEEFILGGSGPKRYLDRYRLGIERNTPTGWHLDLENGVWRWGENATAGGVLRKLITEDQNTDPHTLVDLTASFTSTHDSDGVAWAEEVADADGNFELPIGTSLLEALFDLEDIGDLITTVYLGSVGAEEYRLDAYQTFGEDVTGSAFATGVGLLREGDNIANDSLTVSGVLMKKATHVLIEGKDGVWAKKVLPAWSPGDYVRWAKIEYTRSSNVPTLQRAGLRWLRRQDNGDKQLVAEIVPGADDTQGLYFPSPSSPIWLGNTVTVDTVADGSVHSPMDYNEEPALVTGLELKLGPAGSDTSATAKARSWDIKVKLNHERAGYASSPNQSSASSGPGNGGGGGCKCVHLCKVHVEGTPPSETLTPLYEWNAQDNPDGEVPDVLSWTGLLPNQGPGGSAGTSNYYFKSSSPTEWAKALAMTAGTDLRISGYVGAGTGNGLKVGFFNSGQGIGTDGNNVNLIGTATTLQAGPASNWTFFSVDVTTPVGTTAFALGKIGSSVSFDGIHVEEVVTDPGDDGQEGDLPEDVGTDPASGEGGAAARCDHVHAHGTFASGDLHTEYVREASTEWVDLTDGGATTLHSHAGGSGAPDTADYLVGTAQSGLSAEIVVGTTPGGELGGTWASPTVDATHSGSAHTDFVAKSLYDAKGDLISASADNTPAKLTAGANDTVLMADSGQSTGLKWVASQTPSNLDYNDSAAEGTADTYARGDHVHGMPSGGGGGGSGGAGISWTVFDEVPASPHSNDEEMDGALDGAWTWIASSGTPTDSSLGDWPAGGTQSVPRYNVNSDIPGALVMRPANGGTLQVYRAFAPGSGTAWAVACKVHVANATSTDDRFHMYVENTTPSSADDEPTDGIVAEYRRNVGNFTYRAIRFNNAAASVIELSTPPATAVYMAIVGLTDNTIVSYFSMDGMSWTNYKADSSQDINGNVSHIAMSVRDGHNEAGNGPCIGIVEWIRFRVGDHDLWALGAGNG